MLVDIYAQERSVYCHLTPKKAARKATQRSRPTTTITKNPTHYITARITNFPVIESMRKFAIGLSTVGERQPTGWGAG